MQNLFANLKQGEFLVIVFVVPLWFVSTAAGVVHKPFKCGDPSSPLRHREVRKIVVVFRKKLLSKRFPFKASTFSKLIRHFHGSVQNAIFLFFWRLKSQ